MKIFVYEFFSGGGLAGRPLPPSLAGEGDLMVRALLRDLAELRDVELLASRDARLPALAGLETLAPLPGEDAFTLYARGVAAADAAWPTAPETDRTLERLAQATIAAGRVLLGCRPHAVRLAGSKRATAERLGQAGIAVVPTFAATDEVPPLPGRWVVKPDDGAGCDEAVVLPGRQAAMERMAEAPGRLVAQPWIDGPALSLSLLCAEGSARLLSCNRQRVRVADGRLALEGITVNAVPDVTGELAALGGRIAAAIPDLWGYVGVDLVATAGGPVVLEINPRLTTSYCGLRPALRVNAAELVLGLLRPDRADDWRPPAAQGTAELFLGDPACAARS
ncbi:MAG: ATP-grasp domain-containing protein [Gemmatimonadota bacterium]